MSDKKNRETCHRYIFEPVIILGSCEKANRSSTSIYRERVARRTVRDMYKTGKLSSEMISRLKNVFKK